MAACRMRSTAVSREVLTADHDQSSRRKTGPKNTKGGHGPTLHFIPVTTSRSIAPFDSADRHLAQGGGRYWVKAQLVGGVMGLLARAADTMSAMMRYPASLG